LGVGEVDEREGRGTAWLQLLSLQVDQSANGHDLLTLTHTQRGCFNTKLILYHCCKSLLRIVICSSVRETSEAIGNRTQRDMRRAGALMANTDGLFGASAGEFTRHITGHELTQVEMPDQF